MTAKKTKKAPAKKSSPKKKAEPKADEPDVSKEHQAHVQEQGIDGEETAKRRIEEMEAADAAAKNLKTRENKITKSNLKDYGIKVTPKAVDHDTTWGAYYVDYEAGKEPVTVFARKIDAPFSVGNKEVDEGYLVVDSKGNPKAVERTEFETPGAYTPTL